MTQELEVMKTLAELVIFLFSITIPTYAIAISLLGPDYSEMTERIETEKQNLEKEFQEKAGTGKFILDDLEKRIKEFRRKENKLKSRFNPLSLYPTVVFPNVFFGLSIFTLLTGIYYSNVETFSICLPISVLFMLIGLSILGWALVMIQRAARDSGWKKP